MLSRRPTLEETTAAFHWDIPERYNIGVDICDRHAKTQPDATALIDVSTSQQAREVTFAELRRLSNQTAHCLSQHVSRGERVAVLLPQSVETAVAHIAVLKMGAISLPLFTLFGPDALAYRLKDSGAKAVITTAEGARLIAGFRDDLPALETVYCVNGACIGAEDYHQAIVNQPDKFDPVDTRADDPAILIYTSGTTGPPKGALHAHRVLLGHLPGVEMSHDFFPQPGDRIWTPADWAWIGGLLDVLMPALHHGVPVVACRFEKFTAKVAYELMARHQIRNVFLPPTALKMMRQSDEPVPDGLNLRSVASGGETLGAALIEWGQSQFGVTINEFYGQTECNMIVSSCAALVPAVPGVMGFPVPGHEVTVLDPQSGHICEPAVHGEIAVRAPDPVMFLRYWNRPEATEAKFLSRPDGKWLLTGDIGARQPDGRIRFVGRDDDVISSSGYRIGPGEIEDCLLSHPAVAMAGVVGAPDHLRGEVVVAFVSLAEGAVASDDLATELADFVKSRLSAHEFPRQIVFTDDMPMTTTGKIIRGALRARLNPSA